MPGMVVWRKMFLNLVKYNLFLKFKGNVQFVLLVEGRATTKHLKFIEEYKDFFLYGIRKNKKGNKYTKDNISEEAAEVLLDQLFEDDDTLEDVVGMPASKAIDEINKELSSRSIHKKVLNKGKNVKIIMKLLDKLEGISNPREVLNKSERTLSDEGFCN